MKKKTLFFTLILALIIVPGVILATSANVTEVATAEQLVTATNSGGTVKLTDNVVLEEALVIPAGITVELDLNGKTLDLPATSGYALTVKGNLTITGNGVINVNGAYGITTSTSGGNITIENGIFNGENAVYLIADFGGTVVINDGTYNALYYAVNGVDGYSKNAVQINGGTFNTAVTEGDENVIAGNVIVKSGIFNRVIRGENMSSDANITIKLDTDMNIANLWRASDASDTIVIPTGSKVIIDLNGHNITGTNKLFDVKGAELVVTGNGTIKEAQSDLAPIYISGDSAVKTTVTVGKDVTLEGWAGIFLSSDVKDAKGVDVTFAGKINTKPDANGTLGGGIYINGYVTDTDIVNITLESTAVIDALATAIYAGGYGNWNINGATLKGVESAIAVKAGSFEIKDAKLTATGPDETPTDGFCNGIFPSGAAIQLESNDGYAGGISLNLVGGTYTSEQGYAFYEYLAKSEDGKVDTKATSVKSVSIDGVKFVSAKDSFEVSEDFATKVTKFVKGGTFSSDVTAYKADGTICKADGENFVVLKQSSITVTTPENGLIQLPEGVTANKNNAVEGDTVKLTFSPKDGYQFSKVTVKDALGNVINVNENNEFVMPNTNVTVEAVFAKLPETVTGIDAPVVDLNKEVEEPVVGVTNSDKAEDVLLESLEANEELAKKAENKTTTVAVVITDIILTDQDKKEIQDALADSGADVKISKFFDISVLLKDKADNSTLGNMSELKSEIEFVIALPAELQDVPEGFERTFFVVREHNGEVKALETTLAEDGKSVSFGSNLFSTYALAYVDVPVVADDDKDDVNKDESNKDENSDVPTTGDVVLPVSIALAVVSLAGITFFVVKNRKIKK